MASPKFSENIVILCFERHFSKQNSVFRLKSNIFPPKFFWFPPKFWAGYATAHSGLNHQSFGKDRKLMWVKTETHHFIVSVQTSVSRSLTKT